MDEKILIVDDDPSIVRLVEHILQGKGYRVLIANTGSQALQMAKTEELDLIILDLILPGMDGFEVCHQLRQEPSTTTLPILIMSRKESEKYKTKALNAGANAYLTKPVKPPELNKHVKALLASSSRQPIDKAN